VHSKQNSHERHHRGSVPAEKSESRDPYRDAQLIDIGIVEEAYRQRDSARRINVVLLLIALLSLLVAVILAGKDHTEALVYRDDAAGNIMLMGYAGSDRTPTALAVQNALVHWIQDVRDIPASDAELAGRNKNDALLMVARGSDADTRLHGYFAAFDPATLGTSIHRTVTRVHVDRRTDITYDLTWSEQTSVSGGAPGTNTYQGNVTLAAPPAAPTDPLLGQSNPAGVFISTYVLAAPN
jgi:type IV secretory pathway TrbF-like protein